MEETPLMRFVSHLDGVVHVQGGYVARCPAHRDHRPSLSIRPGSDGRVLVHYWAGCQTLAVLGALGLTWSDLFPAQARRSRR